MVASTRRYSDYSSSPKNGAITYTTIDMQELKTIYLQFKALDLIEHDNLNWKLSSKGMELMMQLRTVKSRS